MHVQRISQMLSDVVESTALVRLADDDRFEFEVGVGPMPITDGDGEAQIELSAWAMMWLDCPETGTKSVLGLAWPIKWLTKEHFRTSIDQALTEMAFSRIAAAYHLETDTLSDDDDFEDDDDFDPDDFGNDGDDDEPGRWLPWFTRPHPSLRWDDDDDDE